MAAPRPSSLRHDEARVVFPPPRVSMAAPRPSSLRHDLMRDSAAKGKKFQWPLRGPHLCGVALRLCLLPPRGSFNGRSAALISAACLEEGTPMTTTRTFQWPLRGPHLCGMMFLCGYITQPVPKVSMAAPRPSSLRRSPAPVRQRGADTFQWPLRGPHLCGATSCGASSNNRERFNGRSAALISAAWAREVVRVSGEYHVSMAAPRPSSLRHGGTAERAVHGGLHVSMAAPRPSSLRPAGVADDEAHRQAHVSMAAPRPSSLRRAGARPTPPTQDEVSMAAPRPSSLRRISSSSSEARSARFNGRSAALISAAGRSDDR